MNKCPICMKRNLETLYDVSDINGDAAGKWTIVQCRDCGTATLSPFPGLGEIETFYSGVFYTSTGARFSKPLEAVRKVLTRGKSRLMQSMLPDGASVMDFGAGAGHFSGIMSGCGYDVHSIDPYSSTATHNHKVLEAAEGLSLDYPDNTFDAVTLWQVLEHLYSPEAYLREFARVLKPGGLLVVSVPNFASFEARFFGKDWLILDPPRHLFQFTPGSIEILARRCGLGKVRLDYGNVELGPFTLLQSMLNKFFGDDNGLFRMLKNRGLRGGVETDFASTAKRVLLSSVLGPLAVIWYVLALQGRSSGVFTMCLKKQ